MPPPKKSDQIHTALETALRQIEELMGEPFLKPPSLTVIEHPDFWALAELHRDEFHIRVSTGVVAAVSDLWADALTNETLCNDDGMHITDDIDHLTHVSLVWLLLHEMEHLSLGHFAFTGKMCLAETAQAQQFSLVSRVDTKPSFPTSIDPNLIEPCLELQADHDAMEMLLDSYSPNEWDELRVRAACISVVMVLIERTDSKRGITHSSHPKAATRIFQLLGHISEMWSHPARAIALQNGIALNPNNFPSDSEKKAFVHDVIRPAFFDVVKIAQTAKADSIRTDLGDPEHFFQDILIAKAGNPETFGSLKTAGAKEWAKLALVNEKIMAMLGH